MKLNITTRPSFGDRYALNDPALDTFDAYAPTHHWFVESFYVSEKATQVIFGERKIIDLASIVTDYNFWLDGAVMTLEGLSARFVGATRREQLLANAILRQLRPQLKWELTQQTLEAAKDKATSLTGKAKGVVGKGAEFLRAIDRLRTHR